MGSDCVQVFSPVHDVVALSSRDLDISDSDAVEDMINRVKPDIIVNCAAYTNVDACETNKELAWKVNVKGTGNLALSVEKFGGLLIHISTDYVFSGNKEVSEPYLEDDSLSPRSFYSKTKLKSEEVIRQATDCHIIVRTAWLYGIRGHNFLKTMLKLALKDPQKEIKVVNDQFGSPTWSYRLALQMDRLVERGGQGTYHATSEGYCAWYELACYFLEKMEVPHTLIPCTTEEYPTPASRPKNSILENKRLKELGINIMPSWQSDVDRFVSKFKGPLMREAKESAL